MADDLPLFDVPEPTPRPVPPRQGSGTSSPTWSRYRPRDTVPCDDCRLTLALADGHGPASLPARWRRRDEIGDRLLCYQHAQARRALDNLPRLDSL